MYKIRIGPIRWQIREFLYDCYINDCSNIHSLRDVREWNKMRKVRHWKGRVKEKKRGTYAVRLETFDIVDILRILATWQHTFKQMEKKETERKF